ncbi:ABC transporter substrate-binding protein [Aureimonas altamirensis]|uniref:ABC transporter substrate-binding protein n=1 Tax=Aureimonas altamirensis TaxID=370622 RepID=UPI0025560F1A|nr:ABC transporter substrate-binding protein [Aureimonas altamirensis]
MRFAAFVGLVAICCGFFAAPSGAAPREDLVLAIGGEPETGFDPVLGWGAYGHPLFQSTLLRRDAGLASQPDLATRWSLSEDRLTWTVTIRPDARFSDDTPLTAEDVAFTFNTARDAAGAIDLSMLEAATAVDAETVTFRLREPAISFTEFFHTLGIVPAASYGPGYARQPVGSGPYRLVSWSEGEQLIVERNPLYYGPAPAFRQLTFLFTGEDGALAAARAGAVDIASVPGMLAGVVPEGFRRQEVRSVDNRGISLPMQAPGKTTPDGLPIGNAVTVDDAIRHAIDMGIDRQVLVEVALGGFGSPATGPADGLPWGNADEAVAYDAQAAARLLDEAGWLAGTGGIRVKDGLRASIPLYYPAGDSTRQILSETVATLVRPLGIEMRPQGAPWSAIRRVMHSEPVMFGFGSHSPFEVYSLYHSSLAGRGYMNPTFYANATVDGHLDAAQAAPGMEASYPHWRAAAFDGDTGYGSRGDAAYAWLVNLTHVYLVGACLDIGEAQIEPHGHGWPITAGIAGWRWTCD